MKRICPSGACVVALIAATAASAQPSGLTLTDKHTGNIPVSEMQVDLAPGTVSAFGLLGIAGNTVTPIENIRDFTMAIKGLDGDAGFGLSVTPARTAFMPMSVHTYYNSLAARIWAGTTLSFGQATVKVEDAMYRQRAWGVETSFYLDAQRDDPMVTYWDRLAKAGNGDMTDICVLPQSKPKDPTLAAGTSTGSEQGSKVPRVVPDEELAVDNKRAQACFDSVRKSLRWNASRAWASWVGGRYSPTASGGSSHGLGRTVVLGLTYGFGDGAKEQAGAITLAFRRTSGEPVLATYGLAQPERRDARLTTLRGVYGSNTLRLLLEASHTQDERPTASQRAFKRAIGLDWRLAEGVWVTARMGRQRRIDNSGEETGATVGLSISPSALIKF